MVNTYPPHFAKFDPKRKVLSINYTSDPDDAPVRLELSEADLEKLDSLLTRTGALFELDTAQSHWTFAVREARNLGEFVMDIAAIDYGADNPTFSYEFAVRVPLERASDLSFDFESIENSTERRRSLLTGWKSALRRALFQPMPRAALADVPTTGCRAEHFHSWAPR